MAVPSLEASKLLTDADIDAAVVNARFLKPLDTGLILKLAKETKHVLTVEENVVSGGFGSAVLEELIKAEIDGLKFRMLGIPDEFIEQGPQKLIRKNLGLDAEGITKEALKLLGGGDTPYRLMSLNIKSQKG